MCSRDRPARKLSARRTRLGGLRLANASGRYDRRFQVRLESGNEIATQQGTGMNPPVHLRKKSKNFPAIILEGSEDKC